MHSFDILAYTLDGAIYCDDCKPAKDSNEEMGVVFADYEYEIHGATCDSCGACYVPSLGGWNPHDDAVGELVRWSRCASCNSQKPYAKDSRDFAEVRAASICRGGFRCDDCGKPSVRFEARS